MEHQQSWFLSNLLCVKGVDTSTHLEERDCEKAIEIKKYPNDENKARKKF
jgi:hypothetical protein